MKKVNLSDKPDKKRPVHVAAVESEVLGGMAQIIAHLTHTRYDDGSPRQVGTISIRTQGAMWIVEARDYDAAARMRVSAASLDDALALMDTCLGADTAPWEPDVYLQQSRVKKR